jgi:hypothetical protein
MMSFIDWTEQDRKRKEKEKRNEQRSNQTHRESGHFNQQGEVAGGDSKVTQQAVHLFPEP